MRFSVNSDEKSVAPGDKLREVIKKFSPCLILIDEWVAYVRMLYGKRDLPGGDFDAHFTFAQTLTESVEGTPGALLVVSIPASDREVGGEGGREALIRLKNVVGRLQTSWRPATQEESYEIVRRRLFQPLNAERSKKRDAVIRRFREECRSIKPSSLRASIPPIMSAACAWRTRFIPSSSTVFTPTGRSSKSLSAHPRRLAFNGRLSSTIFGNATTADSSSFQPTSQSTRTQLRMNCAAICRTTGRPLLKKTSMAHSLCLSAWTARTPYLVVTRRAAALRGRSIEAQLPTAPPRTKA